MTLIAIPVMPNPPFWGDRAKLLPNNKLALWSTKYRRAGLLNWPVVAIPKGFIAIVRWGALADAKRKELGGSFGDEMWVCIVQS